MKTGLSLSLSKVRISDCVWVYECTCVGWCLMLCLSVIVWVSDCVGVGLWVCECVSVIVCVSVNVFVSDCVCVLTFWSYSCSPVCLRRKLSIAVDRIW